MSVLKGEGKVPILFGSKSVVAGPRTHATYLARPDLAGEWPTAVLVPSAWGITSSVKDLARRLARQGVAAVGVDLFRGKQPERSADLSAAERAMSEVPPDRAARDLADIIRFIANPAGFWSNAEDGFAVVGIGSGGHHAVAAADRFDAPLVLAASASLGDVPAGFTAPLLGLYGREDETVSVDEVMAARAALPHAEWVLYDHVGHDFLDDYRPGFDLEAYQDAVERISGFCEKHLPPVRSAG